MLPCPVVSAQEGFVPPLAGGWESLTPCSPTTLQHPRNSHSPPGKGTALPPNTGPSKQTAQRVARKMLRGQKDRVRIKPRPLIPGQMADPEAHATSRANLKSSVWYTLGYKIIFRHTFLKVFFALLVAKNNSFVIKSCFSKLT